MELIILDTKEHKKEALQLLMSVMEDDNLEMLLRKRTDSGSKAQIAWFNMLCRYIAKESGHSPEEVKQITEGVKEGIKKDVFGMLDSDVMGEPMKFIPRTDYYGKDGISELINRAYRLGADLNIFLPPPIKK